MSAYRPVTAYVPRPQAPPPGFDLADFLRVVSVRRGLIVKTILATMILAALFAFSLPTQWTSSAVVMLDGRKNNVTDSAAVLSALVPDPATLQNQVQIITSRELAQKVITDLKLYDDSEYNTALASPGLAAMLNPNNWDGLPPVDADRAHEQVMQNFLRHVSAEANGLSTALTVSVSAREPVKAARIANALVQAYVDDQVARKHQATSETTQWLSARADQLAGQLQEQNEAVQRYKAQNGLADAGPGTSLVDAQMLGINSQIVEAKSALDQKLADQGRLQQTGGDPASTSQVMASPVITAMRSQQTELARQEADLASKYGPLYPKLLSVQAQRKDLEQKIAQEMGRISGAVSNDVAAARNHLASLQSSLARAEQLGVNQNMARGQLAALESNASATRTAYETFLQRLRSAQDQDATLLPESRVLSAASVPQAPASPKRKLIVGAALPLGALLGVIAALLLERFGHLLPVKANGPRRAGLMPPKKNRAGAAPDWLAMDWDGPPVLGEINNTHALRAADYVIDWPESRFAHAAAALVRQLESQDGDGAVVALTAPGPGDSKSVIAVSLARAAALMGKKVVLVDCDPAHRSAAALQAEVSAGLYEVLSGAVPLNQALAKDPRGKLYLLSLMQPPAANMFGSPQMGRLLDILRDGCDFVVLDCGPALAGPDAAMIARHADATLLVSPRGKLRTRAMAHATQLLQSAHAAPVGLVIAS